MGLEALAKFLAKSGKKASALGGEAVNLGKKYPKAASTLAGVAGGSALTAHAMGDHDEPDADDYGGPSDNDEDDMRREKIKRLLQELE